VDSFVRSLLSASLTVEDGVGDRCHAIPDGAPALNTKSGQHCLARTWRINVNVLAAAHSIGLAANDRGEVSGTIDEEVVLAAISALAVDHPGHDELLAEAAMRVELSRSAGVEQLDANSVLNRSRSATTVQLRYRSEMADVFMDLAIDIGIRAAGELAETPA
jgi:hypothetical protein